MNIQIFGKSKCFDTKKAERYFKERRVKYQYIDMKKYGISRGELNGVLRSVPLSDLVDPKHPDAALLQYLAYDQDKVEKVLENPTLLRTPIVRNGKQATVGYQPEQWKTWNDKIPPLFGTPPPLPLAKLEHMFYNGGINQEEG